MATTRKRTKTAVHDLDEGGFLVRGTTNVGEALRMIIDDDGVNWKLDDILGFVHPERFEDPEMTAAEREQNKLDAAHLFARMLNPKNHRAGWFRVSPCWCGDHGWHWDTAKGPGRGNFQGVMFE